jgi:hypothetical protein
MAQGRSYVINSKEKWFYNVIPKNCCSSLKFSIRDNLFKSFPDSKDIKYNTEDEELIYEITADLHVNFDKTFSPHDIYISPLLNKSIESLNINLEEYYKFTVVRDPFARFSSFFIDKIVNSKYYPRYRKINKWKKLINSDETNENKLLEVLTTIENESNEKREYHTKSQSWLMNLKHIKYDKILRTENINEDFESIRQKYNFNPLKKINKTFKDPEVLELLNKHKDRILSIYKDDVELLTKLKF